MKTAAEIIPPLHSSTGIDSHRKFHIHVLICFSQLPTVRSRRNNFLSAKRGWTPNVKATPGSLGDIQGPGWAVPQADTSEAESRYEYCLGASSLLRVLNRKQTVRMEKNFFFITDRG